jgi:hypothetical protein
MGRASPINTPIRRIVGCCARAASGHAAAVPPSNVIKSRRLNRSNCIRWNGHYACACYHPLFVFNQFGDLERCALRPGNVHSADGWDGVLKPVVARYQGKVSRIYFRADAAFAMPEVYEFLEAERHEAFDCHAFKRQEECVQMPVKIARSAPRPSFGLLELLLAIHTSRQSCCKAGKARIFALVLE